MVQSKVRGCDLGSFVEEVQARLARDLHLPTGDYLQYGGTYEKLQSGRARLTLVVPLTFLLVFGLLYANFRRFSLACCRSLLPRRTRYSQFPIPRGSSS